MIEYVENKFKEYGIQGKVLPEESLMESEAHKEAESELESLIREEVIRRIDIAKKIDQIYRESAKELKDRRVAATVAEELNENIISNWKDICLKEGRIWGSEVFDDHALGLVEARFPAKSSKP